MLSQFKREVSEAVDDISVIGVMASGEYSHGRVSRCKGLSDIGTQHVIEILEPIWTTKTETASRVRGRIESVLDYAKVRGYRQGENPARWKAQLDAAAGLVKAGGRLVAILPSGAKKQEVLDGFLKQWHGPFNNEFAGTSVSVVVLVADAP